MDVIRVYNKSEDGYKRLEAAKHTIEAFVPTIEIELKEIYYDYGSRWKYTGLCVTRRGVPDSGYQLSDGRAYEAIVCGSLSQFSEAVFGIIAVLQVRG